MEGLVDGLHVFRAASPLQEVGRSGLYQLRHVHSSSNAQSYSNPSWKWQIYDTMWPGPVGGRVEFPMGADASRKRTFFKPGQSSWLSQVGDELTRISRLCTFSLVFASCCFYCEYFSTDCKGTIVDLKCGGSHSYIWQTKDFLIFNLLISSLLHLLLVPLFLTIPYLSEYTLTFLYREKNNFIIFIYNENVPLLTESHWYGSHPVKGRL